MRTARNILIPKIIKSEIVT